MSIAKDTVNLFSFSGGGAKGLWMCEFLHYFFNSWGINHNEFYKYVSAVTGTSVGALIAAGLLIGKTPRELRDILTMYLPWVFTTSPVNPSVVYGNVDATAFATFATPLYKGGERGLGSEDAIDVPGYGDVLLPRVIDHVFGNIRLKELPAPFACVGVSKKTGQDVIMSSIENMPMFYNGTTDDEAIVYDNNMKLADALKITTAAPVFLKNYNYEGVDFVDGGLAANNPTDIAETMATILHPLRKRKLICNFTSGREEFNAESGSWFGGGIKEVFSLLGLTIGAVENLQIKLNKIDTTYSVNNRYMYTCYPDIDKTKGAIDKTNQDARNYYNSFAITTALRDTQDIVAITDRLNQM